MSVHFTATRLLLVMLGLSLLNFRCTSDPELTNRGTVEGYRPIYMSHEAMRKVTPQGPRSLKHPGKIYVRGSYLFINEPGEGIHIINNMNPANPQPLAFVAIPGNGDMAVKGNVLYVDNATDLITLDISNPQQVQVLNRVENAFPANAYPAPTGVLFECVDKSKGVVVGWEKAMLDNPRCLR